MAWLNSIKRTWKVKRRQRLLDDRLRALSAEEYQKVRAYLSVNPGDDAFIQQFLSGGTGQADRDR